MHFNTPPPNTSIVVHYNTKTHDAMVRGQSTWNLQQIASALFWAMIEEILSGESLDLDSGWVTLKKNNGIH